MTELEQYPAEIENAQKAVDAGWQIYFGADEALAEIDRAIVQQANEEGRNDGQRRLLAEEARAGSDAYRQAHEAKVNAKTAVNELQFRADRLVREYEVAKLRFMASNGITAV